MMALEYVKLVDVEFKRGGAALVIEHCPRLREVVLEKCVNVDFVCNTDSNSLQKLFIKDCPDLLDFCDDPWGFYPQLEVQVINCPRWDRSTKRRRS